MFFLPAEWHKQSYIQLQGKLDQMVSDLTGHVPSCNLRTTIKREFWRMIKSLKTELH